MITQPIDNARTVTLYGNTRPEANAKHDRGRVADSLPLDHMLLRFRRIVREMIVHGDRMRENLNRSRGVVFSGSVLLELAKRGISREQAYEWVQRNAMLSYAEQRDFKGLVECDTDIMRVLTRSEIERAFDLNEQFKYVDHIFDRVFQPVSAKG